MTIQSKMKLEYKKYFSIPKRIKSTLQSIFSYLENKSSCGKLLRIALGIVEDLKVDNIMIGEITVYSASIGIRFPFDFELEKRIRSWVEDNKKKFTSCDVRDYFSSQWKDGEIVPYIVRYWNIYFDISDRYRGIIELKLDSRLPGTTCAINTLKDEIEREAAIYEIVCPQGKMEAI